MTGAAQLNFRVMIGDDRDNIVNPRRSLMERPDLDGYRLTSPDTPDVWVVMGGRRHRIASEKVHNALFTNDAHHTLSNVDMDVVDPGPELNEGTCLVRSPSTGKIYMLTGRGQTLHLMHVLNYDSFLDYAFNVAKVLEIPDLIIDALREGKAIISAGSRTAVHAFSVKTVSPGKDFAPLG